MIARPYLVQSFTRDCFQRCAGEAAGAVLRHLRRPCRAAEHWLQVRCSSLFPCESANELVEGLPSGSCAAFGAHLSCQQRTDCLSVGCRWPFGPVAIITPFNFPLEIPALQLMGALYMGNKALLHVDRRCVHDSQPSVPSHRSSSAPRTRARRPVCVPAPAVLLRATAELIR